MHLLLNGLWLSRFLEWQIYDFFGAYAGDFVQIGFIYE